MVVSEPYISDEHYKSPSDRDKALATHLRTLASRLEYSAKRFTDPKMQGSLVGAELHPKELEDSALEAIIVDYLRANYKRIGDLSLAYGLIKLVRMGSQVYRG